MAKSKKAVAPIILDSLGAKLDASPVEEPQIDAAEEKWSFIPPEELEGKISIDYNINELIEDEANRVKKLGAEMVEFAKKHNAIGLAAPQIGVFEKIFVYLHNQDKWIICLNPWYIHNHTPIVATREGCLTFPKEEYIMKRWKRISVSYYTFDEKGKLIRKTNDLYGINSIIYQHEFDHLRGNTIHLHGEKIDSKVPIALPVDQVYKPEEDPNKIEEEKVT